jgi:hypothetical protein
MGTSACNFIASIDFPPGTMHPLTETEAGLLHPWCGELHLNGTWLIYGANVHPETDEETEETWVYRHMT